MTFSTRSQMCGVVNGSLLKLTCRNVRGVPSYGTKQSTVTASGRYEQGADIDHIA